MNSAPPNLVPRFLAVAIKRHLISDRGGETHAGHVQWVVLHGIPTRDSSCPDEDGTGIIY